MKYYDVRQDLGVDYGIVEYPPLPPSPGGGSQSFLAGMRIVLPLEDALVFIVDSPADRPPLHFVGNRVPVVSDALIGALERAGVDNFQSLPAILLNPDTGEEWRNYKCLNVLGLVDAAARDSVSELIMPGGEQPGQVRELLSYTSLVLDGRAVHGLLMFRLVTSPAVLLVHESVFAALRASAPPGGWGIWAKQIRVV